MDPMPWLNQGQILMFQLLFWVELIKQPHLQE